MDIYTFINYIPSTPNILVITVNDCPRSDETHQYGLRRRLSYIHEEMKIYCERYCKRESGESVKVII